MTSERLAHAVVIVAAVIGAIVCPAVRAQEPPARVAIRELAWDPLVPIRERLQSSDKTVEISKDWLDGYAPGHLTARDVIEDAAVRSDVVAIVEVGTVGTVLAEHETWVNTQLTGSIRQVIRQRRGRSFRIGQNLDIQVSGGEIKVGQVLVTTRGTKPVVPANELYLLFLEISGDHLRSLHHPLLYNRGELSYTYTRAVPYEGTNPLQGFSLSEVSKISRRAKKSWLCGTECGHE